jgi:DNA polymerase elongation subunit (family B)
MTKPRLFTACVFDIETTALEAVGAGMVLVAVVKPLGDPKCRVFRIDRSGDEFGHEVNLLKKLFVELEKYNLVIGHNIEGFDIPFIKTRARVLGVPFTYRPLVYDTLKGFKRTGFRTVLNKIGKPSAGLDMVVDGYGHTQRKTKIYPAAWWASVWGSVSDRSVAMTEMIEHCVRDVEMNELVWWDVFQDDPNPTLKRCK